MKSDFDRSASYDIGTTPANVSLRVAAQLATMKGGFQGETETLVAHQLATAQVLNLAGIVGLMRGRYQAFSNRLHQITRNFQGPAATNMAQLEHDKWESMCQSAIMISIALQVYGITVT